MATSAVLLLLVGAAASARHDDWREIWEESKQNIPVAAHLNHFPPLCAAAVVAETCSLLNDQTPSFFGSAADNNSSVVHAAELGASLYASPSSVRHFLQTLDLFNFETNPTALASNAFGVSCRLLCQKLQASFDPGELPATSDVACVFKPSAAGVVCDQDVSPEALSKDSEQMGSQEKSPGGNELSSFHPSSADLATVLPNVMPDQSYGYLRLLTAQLFRIYPVTEGTFPSTVLVSNSGCADLLPDCNHIATNRWCEEQFSPKYWQWNQKQCPQSCGICDPPATTAPTVAPATRAPTAVPAAGAVKKHLCPDLKPDCATIAANGWCKEANSPQYWQWNQKQCPRSCQTGATCAIEDLTKPPVEGSPAAKAAEKLPTARAWASTAMRNLGTNRGGALLTKWFRNNDVSTRNKVKMVISSVLNVLSGPPYFRTNVEECERVKALAWVTPGEKNSQGRYVINICERAVNYGCNICVVGTIVHEASHHPVAFTGDVTYDLAKIRELDTSEALANAENFAYFFRDLNGGM